jgi:subtilisin
VRRVGGLASPTARIDSVDQRVDGDIAVLDTGVDAAHPDLNVFASKDCVGDGITGDPIGHGTEVAGVAAALDNKFGTVGVAPGARLWSVRIFATDGSLSLDSLLCGLDYVRLNADKVDAAVLAFENDGSPDGVCGVVASRTGRVNGHLKYQVVDPVDLAICRGTAAGVTFVAAAGNDSADAANTVSASYPEVVAVSAFTDTDGKPGGRSPAAFCLPSERDDTFASYSNYGRVVDLSAPGTCTFTTFPGGLYSVDVGTSFSAPHVAGAVALIKARNPRATPLTVAAQLQATKERGLVRGDPDGIAEGVLNVARL